MDIVSINKYLSKYVNTPINETNETDERKKLYILLTLINVDIDENVCKSIEKIILTERTIINEIKSKDKIVIWQGDITTLKVDVIVNAANDEMMGCFDPNHKCIDNIIHSKAGPKLRMICRRMRNTEGKLGTKGRITIGFCLPAKYIIHVVGPIYDINVDQRHKLAECYTSSIDICRRYRLKSIAFCCISTGLYGYPKKEAAYVAITTIKKIINDYDIQVIFNTFTDSDTEIYKYLM